MSELSAPTWKMLPDERARGILKLDKNLFTFQLNVLTLKVPFESINFVNTRFKDLILKCPRLSEVKVLNVDCPIISSFKLIFLNPIKCLEIRELKYQINDDILDVLEKHSIKSKQYCVEFYYQNWLYDEILREILPKDISNIAGFSTIGHIAHMNLRDEHLKYKNIIGEVILDKIPNIKTVVNKIQTIDNAYRNFQMELLAGEKNYITTIKEHGFIYHLDFSKVYWNSRLGTEHQRITKIIPQTSLVFDLFAGVGPFSVPLAKKGCTVFANDLNPDSFLWLGKNMKLSKANDSNYSIFNLDAREFILSIVKKNIIKYLKEKDSFQSIHIIMNLPAIAYTFLDSFINLLPIELLMNHNSIIMDSDNLDNNVELSDTKADLVSKQECKNKKGFNDPNYNIAKKVVASDSAVKKLLDIKIHCYCFSKGASDPLEQAKNQIESVLNTKLIDNCEVKIVRNVAPNKEMVYVGFQLGEDILIQKNLTSEEPTLKRIRTN